MLQLVAALDAHGLQSCVRAGGMSLSKGEAGTIVSASSAQRTAAPNPDSFILRLSNRRRKARKAQHAHKWIRPDAVRIDSDGNAVRTAATTALPPTAAILPHHLPPSRRPPAALPPRPLDSAPRRSRGPTPRTCGG